MKLGYTAEAVRTAEEPLLGALGVDTLMRRAAAGLATACRRELLASLGRVTGSRIVVLAGPGKNGGDAMLASANLADRGAHVTIVDALGGLFPSARETAERAGCRITPLGHGTEALLADADLVLDGVLGTGSRPGLPADLAGVLTRWQAGAGRRPGDTSLTSGRQQAGDRQQIVIAVDVPTGVDATTGVTGAAHVRADRTVTFGACTSGLLLPGGADAAGVVELVDIGLSMGSQVPAVESPDDGDLADAWPVPDPRSHKYARGVLGLIAGSPRYPGAGRLAAAGAIATGLGMLRLHTAPEVLAGVLTSWPEAVGEHGRVQAWALGPGTPDALLMRRAIIDAETRGLPVAIDAAGISLITRPLETNCIVTPHAGELAVLLGRLGTGAPDRSEIEADPASYAVRAAQALDGVVLLKGRRTIIARPQGSIVAPPPGPVNLATAGTGDVLTGVLGALLATAHGDLARIAGLAVLVHSAAGRRTTHASGLASRIEAAVTELIADRRP